MDLREYLFRKRMTITQMCEKLECSRTHLSEIIHGRRKASRRLAKDIERITEGEVSAQSISSIDVKS